MDKLKNKFEIILGFVTLVISFSAFKDELAKINIPLGYATLTVSSYFLYCVYGFSFCLYLFIMENVFRDTKIGLWKMWDYLIRVAYVIFVFILLTPVLLLLNWTFYTLIKRSFSDILNILATISTILAALLTSVANFLLRKAKIKEEIAMEEILELESATKLYNDGYFSQSVLEAFKVLQTHLYGKITDRNIRVQRHDFNAILHIALKEGIVKEADLPYIQDLKSMRNIAAHSDINHTKENAEKALIFVKSLIIKQF